MENFKRRLISVTASSSDSVESLDSEDQGEGPSGSEPRAEPSNINGASLTVNRASRAGEDSGLPGVNLALRSRAEAPIARTARSSGGHRGQVSQSTSWSDYEVQTLTSLCSVFDNAGWRIKWSAVATAFHSSCKDSSRTTQALASKWLRLKKHRNTGESHHAQTEEGTAVPETITAATEAEDPGGQLPPVDETETATLTNDGREEENRAIPSSSAQDPERRLPEGDAQTTDNNPETSEIPEPFRRSFHGYYRWSSRSFDRVAVNRVGKDCPKQWYSWANTLISEMMGERLGRNQNLIGRLNALVYAAARTMGKEYRDLKCQRSEQEREWFQKTRSERKKLQMLVIDLEMELKRRKERRRPKTEERANLHKLVQSLGVRSTHLLKCRKESAQQKLVLLEARISLRETEKERKQLRKRYADTPSLRLLASEQKQKQSAAEPPMAEAEQYWRSIIGQRKKTSPGNVPILRNWRTEMKEEYPELSEAGEESKILEEIDKAIRKARPWKAPGCDGIQAHWWKALPVASLWLTRIVAEWLQSTKVPAGWIARGRTVLIPKKGDLTKAENFRPITCLNSCYKVLTATVNALLLDHLKLGRAIPPNQRALRKHEWACQHAMLLDQAIIRDSLSREKPISVAWLDYKKAFDSIAHSYLRWVLESVNTPKKLGTILERLMSSWVTRLEIGGPNAKGKKRSAPIKVLNGIFQGDSLSPTLFILCVAPLSYAIDKAVRPCRSSTGRSKGIGFELGHQFYVDDLKLYARTPEELELKLTAAAEASTAIGLSLNIGKCAQAHSTPSERAAAHIPIIGPRSTYCYLGIDQRILIEPDALETTLLSALLAKVKNIFASELTFGQKVHAYNSIATASLRYYLQLTGGFRSKLLGSLKNARDMDGAVRKALVKEKFRFRSSCVSRLYLPRAAGGCGLESLEAVLEDSIVSQYSYLVTSSEMRPILHLYEALNARNKRTLVSDAQKVLRTYGIEVDVSQVGESNEVSVSGQAFTHPTKLKRCLVGSMKAERQTRRLAAWRALPLAGRFPNNTQIDLALSTKWLQVGNLSTLNARNAMAVQEGTLLTRALTATGDANVRCRWCDAAPETAEHITSSCQKWLPTLFLARHNAVARVILYAMCERYHLAPIHYSQNVPAVLENGECKILWDQTVMTRKPLRHNKPDMVVFDKKAKRILLIEVSTARATGLVAQRCLKINRYTVNSTVVENETVLPYPPGPNLLGEMSSFYKQDVSFLPVVVGTCGEQLASVVDDLKTKLKLSKLKLGNMTERLSRAAVIGTSRVVKAHFARGTSLGTVSQ